MELVENSSGKHKGDRPTPEEVINYAVKRLKEIRIYEKENRCGRQLCYESG